MSRASGAAPDLADLVIRGARVIDGSGTPARVADVAVAGDRIVAVGDLRQVRGGTEIDARGRAVAPGFIDTHTHDDRALVVDPLMACKVSQGVTTVVTGNCGISLAPLRHQGTVPPSLDVFGADGGAFAPTFEGYLEGLRKDPPALNAACQVGHSTLRVGAMRTLDRAATDDEVLAMRTGVERALLAGAIGFSTCLSDPEAAAAPTEEVMRLVEPLSKTGALHSTHIRDEADGVVEALREAFAIGRHAGVPVVVSHHKCVGRPNHGRTRETLAVIEAARATQPIGLDVYPYTASSIYLDPSRARRASRTIVAWSRARPDAAGRDLADVAAEMGVSMEEACLRLRPGGGIYFMMDEDDVRRVLAYPHTMIGSDGTPHDEHPHPRLWGTFPRVLGRYARELGLFSLEEAVRRMTSLPATRFGLVDRGTLRPGAFADLVLFDPEAIGDRATFERPTEPGVGVELVMVNGRAVWRDGGPTGARPGRVLGAGHRRPTGSLSAW
jgi:N-acyl-D-amino-acid deacylase